MHPILFILALIVGAAHLWLAWRFYWLSDDDFRESADLTVPLAAVGICVLTAAGLTMGGVLT